MLRILMMRDLTGIQRGYLTALKPTGESTRCGRLWLIRCTCGNKIVMAAAAFTHKARRVNQAKRSCGCIRKRNRSSRYKGVGDLSSTRWRNICAKARTRGLPLQITAQFAWDLFVAQGKRCALTNVPLTLSPKSMKAGASSASLDRIDSSKGYIPGNVQWLHRDINFMKTSLPQSEFINWCRLVADHAGRIKYPARKLRLC